MPCRSNQDFLKGGGWQWPRTNFGTRSGPKGFANLATALASLPCSPRYRDEPTLYLTRLTHCRGPFFNRSLDVLEFYRREFRRVRRSRVAPNLILSAEDLAFFDGQTPIQLYTPPRLDLPASGLGGWLLRGHCSHPRGRRVETACAGTRPTCCASSSTCTRMSPPS